MFNPHILILIGFKHTGKSTIGRLLANQLKYRLMDLDKVIANKYAHQTGQPYSCRQIMKAHGENIFRELEQQALKQILHKTSPMVLALGGGTAMNSDIQKQIASYKIIHLTAPRQVVFDRIMKTGKPAFFTVDKSPWDVFNALWEERVPVYEKLANLTVNNESSVDTAVKKILDWLTQEHFL